MTKRYYGTDAPRSTGPHPNPLEDERCPTCNMTDAGYVVYIEGWCRDPWHGDDHLRQRANQQITHTEGQ